MALDVRRSDDQDLDSVLESYWNYLRHSAAFNIKQLKVEAQNLIEEESRLSEKIEDSGLIGSEVNEAIALLGKLFLCAIALLEESYKSRDDPEAVSLAEKLLNLFIKIYNKLVSSFNSIEYEYDRLSQKLREKVELETRLSRELENLLITFIEYENKEEEFESTINYLKNRLEQKPIPPKPSSEPIAMVSSASSSPDKGPIDLCDIYEVAYNSSKVHLHFCNGSKIEANGKLFIDRKIVQEGLLRVEEYEDLKKKSNSYIILFKAISDDRNVPGLLEIYELNYELILCRDKRPRC